MRALLIALILGLASAACHQSAPPAPSSALPAPSGHAKKALEAAPPPLSAKRKLRRLHLTLRGEEPTLQQYQAAKDAEAGGTLEAFLRAELERILGSPEFYREMVRWGHEYLGVGDYKRGVFLGGFSNPWGGGQAIKLRRCPSGTLHQDVWGVFQTDAGGRPVIGSGDPASICDDPAAIMRDVEPWWAPGTTTPVIGTAGSGRRSHNGKDCGVGQPSGDDLSFADGADLGCSCGPNLVYCYPTEQYRPPASTRGFDVDSNAFFEKSQRRLIFEEPARLFAHVVTNDAPFSDLVLGTYTVAPRLLQHAYVRWGRQNSANASLDDSSWWRRATEEWSPVELPELNPNLLADRNYHFDPATDPGEPLGVPAAGVLSQLAPNGWYPRERVRAARYLEIFACRSFTAPDPSVVFTPDFVNDPQTQGPCQHCHSTIEPAAIHFKRLEVEDDNPYLFHGRANLGGIGPWKWPTPYRNVASPPREPYRRWAAQFIPGTKLTPVSAEVLAANPDARFIDYLRPGETLFGLQGDGTIGPLGFAKILVASGEFDRCAVRRIYERIMDRPLDLTTEAELERSLTSSFTSSGRKVKALIRALVTRDEFWRGR